MSVNFKNDIKAQVSEKKAIDKSMRDKKIDELVEKIEHNPILLDDISVDKLLKIKEHYENKIKRLKNNL